MLARDRKHALALTFAALIAGCTATTGKPSALAVPTPSPAAWSMRSVSAAAGTFGPDGARYALPGHEMPGFLSCNPLRVSVRETATLDVAGGQRAVAWREDITGAGADPRLDDCDRGIQLIDDIEKGYPAYTDTSWINDGLTPPTTEPGWQHVLVFQASKHLRLVMSDIKGEDVVEVSVY